MAKKDYSSLKYNIVRHVGVISHGTKGWSKQVNLVSWNNGPVVLDIRDWNYDQTKFTKGVTMSADDASRLGGLISQLGLSPVDILPYPDAPEEQGLDLEDKGFGFFGGMN